MAVGIRDDPQYYESRCQVLEVADPVQQSDTLPDDLTEDGEIQNRRNSRWRKRDAPKLYNDSALPLSALLIQDQVNAAAA